MAKIIQQLSVFLENKEGRLDKVLKTLTAGDVNIVSLSLADTADYGMLRMIVAKPEKGRMVLREEGIMAMLTDVVAFHCPHETGSLSKALHEVVSSGINVEYMYALATSADDASIVVKADDLAHTAEVLTNAGFKLVSPEELVG